MVLILTPDTGIVACLLSAIHFEGETLDSAPEEFFIDMCVDRQRNILKHYICCWTCVSVCAISSSRCVIYTKLYTAAEALWISEVYEFALTLNPPRRTTHTLMQTRRHKPRPAPRLSHFHQHTPFLLGKPSLYT